MTRAEAEPSQFRLSVALGISVVIHVILALLTFWAPLTRQVAQADVPEETLLQFTFANDVETPSDEPQQSAGLPLPQPTQPPAPAEAPDFEPEGTPSLDAPSSDGIPLEPEPRPLEPAEEVSQQEPQQEPVDATDDAEAATDLPQADEDDATRNRPEPADSAASGAASPQIDLNRALRDFGDAVSRARAAQPQNPGSGRARNTFQPDPSSVPPSGFGAGNLTFESRDFDWTDYARQIYMALWRAWHNRLYQTTEDFEKWAHQNTSWYLKHWSQIRFVIERNGDVTGISIETPSGCLPLDQSAYDALVEVILPQLPADFPRDREVVHVRFIANGPINQMRPTLSQLKRMGMF